MDDSSFFPFSSPHPFTVYDKSCCTAEIAGIECPKQRMRRALEPVQLANRTFSRIDLNGDGTINVEEAVGKETASFGCFWEHLTLIQIKFLVLEKEMTEEQLASDKHWFHQLDKDGDGKLQPKELDFALKH